MNHENIHFMEIGVWWIIGLLVLAFVLFFIGAYAWKIHQYRSKKGHQLDAIRERYIKGEMSKDKFIKLMRGL